MTEDSNVYATIAARPSSDVEDLTTHVPEPKWSGAVRTLGLLLPSSWVWLTVCVWWTWRLLALYARGDFDAVPADSPRLLAGLAQDLFAMATLFGLLRLVCALASPDRDPRTSATVWATRIAMVLLGFSALVRIVDLVHCALEKTAPTVAFWLRLVQSPGSVLLHGGAFAALVSAIATAAIGRYALSSDLETAWRLAGPVPRGRALLLTIVSCALGLAATVASLTGVWRHGERDWGRNPELHALAGLHDALEQRDRALPPKLEP
jgi:hypothetical protein